MKNLLNKQKNKGFTMIELIIVISILGILAAFALPRFGSFTTSAKTASREAIVGTLNASLGILNAQWTANGASGAGPITLQGGGAVTVVTTTGYPDMSIAAATSPTCVTLVNSLLSGMSAQIVPVVGTVGTSCNITNVNWTAPIVLTTNNAV